MAYNTPTKLLIIFLMISCITLESLHLVDESNALLSSINNSSHKGVFSTNFQEELSFNYTDSFSESTLSTHLSNLSIGYFNDLSLEFIVEGSQSTKSGILVIFSYADIEIEFVIERIYQDGTNQHINRAFYSSSEFQENVNFSVYFAAEAPYGKNGSITILTSSSFNRLPIVNLSEEVQTLVFTPENFTFEGNLFGVKEYSLISVINNTFDQNYSLNLMIEFDSSEFQSFESTINILNNNFEITTFSFDANSHIIEVIEFELGEGLNILKVIFHVEMSSNLIEISNLEFQANLFENENPGGIYHAFVWEDVIDETIDLSSLKPSSLQNEHILNISLVLSFEGTKIYSGIGYTLALGTEVIEAGSITSSKQTSEEQTIFIEGFTQNYQESLLLQFTATDSGSGEIFIYNTSTIEIMQIGHLLDGEYTKKLENEIVIQTPSFGTATKTYYDVVYVDDASQLFRLNLSLNIETTDLNYESITVYGKTNKIIAFTSTIAGVGNHLISEQITLIDGYNEIELVLNILGKGAVVTIKDFVYSIQPESETVQPPQPNEQEDIFKIPLFKSPQSIALALFVLFDCWLLLGIFLRLYRGFKAKKKHQTENDEYILEIAQLSQES